MSNTLCLSNGNNPADLHEAREEWRAAALARGAVVALGPSDPAAARLGWARALLRAGDDATARREVLRVLEDAPLYDDGLELLLEVRERLAGGSGG